MAIGSYQFAHPPDFAKNESLNFVFEIEAGNKSDLAPGMVWIDSSANGGDGAIKWVLMDGTTIVTIPLPAEGGGDADTLDGQDGTFYLDRDNHEGTQLADTISNLAATVQAYRLDQFANPTAAVNLNSQKITNLANGTANGDGVNFSQLGAAVAGLASQAYVDSAIDDLVGGASAAYDTLVELQALLEGDAASIATLTTAVNARARKFTATIGDNSATEIDVVHGFGNRNNIWQVRRAAAPYSKVEPGSEQTDTNTLRLGFGSDAPATGEFVVMIANVG